MENKGNICILLTSAKGTIRCDERAENCEHSVSVSVETAGGRGKQQSRELSVPAWG